MPALPALPAKKMGLGLCRAVPAGSDSALAVPCRQRLSTCRHCRRQCEPSCRKASGGLPYWLTGIKGCARESTQPGLQPTAGVRVVTLVGSRVLEQPTDNVEGLHRSVHPPARIHGTFTCAQLHGHVRRTQFQPSATAASGCGTGLSLFRFRVSTPSAPA